MKPLDIGKAARINIPPDSVKLFEQLALQLCSK